MNQLKHEVDITSATNDFIKKLFRNGCWQQLMFYLVMQSIMYAGVFVAFSGTFTSAGVDYQCDVPENYSSLKALPNQCHIWNEVANKTEPCTFGYKFSFYQSFIKTSSVSDFSLVCEGRYLDSAAQSCVMAGFFIGGIFGPLIADRFGRRWVLFIGLLICGVVGIFIGFIHNIYLFLFSNLILGVTREVTMSVGFVFALEFIPNDRQGWYGMVTQVLWSFNLVILGILAFFVREWRYLQILGSLPILLSGLLFFIVPESPRWLITNGRFDQLQNLVDSFANKVNRLKFDSSEVILLKKVYRKCNDPSVSRRDSTKYSPLDIFRSRSLVLWSFILTLGWIFIILSYYGATMLSVTLSGNKYLSFILQAAIEMPCYFITLVALSRGRNATLLCLSFITGASFITIGFIDRRHYLSVLILSIVGKGSLASMFYVIVVTSLYIYPTTIRIFGCSLPSAIGKLFAVVVPHFAKLRHVYVWLPTLIIGVASCFIGIINLFFPDWVDRPLPETMKDLDLLKKETGLRVQRRKNHSISTSSLPK